MSSLAKVTAEGQTTIPANVRAALQVGPDDEVVWEILGAGIVQVRRARPYDMEFLKALESTVANEWDSEADNEAYRDL